MATRLFVPFAHAVRTAGPEVWPENPLSTYPCWCGDLLQVGAMRRPLEGGKKSLARSQTGARSN